MPYTSEVEGGLGESVARAIPDAWISDYLGKRFQRVCSEWLVDQARKDKLPIAATSVGSWWGTNPQTRSQTDIDVLAGDRIGKRLLIGECKYRNEFDVSQVIEDLEGKRHLVRGYDAEFLYLFSRLKIDERITMARPDVRLVSLEDL